MLPFDETLYDAALFTGAAALLTLVAFLFGSTRRRGLLPMVGIMAGGLLVLGLFNAYGWQIDSLLARRLVREAILAIIAFGFIKVGVLFVLQTMLARRGIPRILDDFFFALALIAYAIYRLNAVGVNLAGLITTSAVITGALAFSAQETLGNLWGGIALQVEKTCRIGDWVRIDDSVGEVVSIRWRYMAIATNSNETIVIPNSQVMKNRVILIGRRGEDQTHWRRLVSFSVEYAHPPARVIDLVQRALERAEIPNVARVPLPAVHCQKFDDSGVEYQVVYFIDNPARELWTDSQIRQHVFAALSREGLGIPFPRRVLELRRNARGETDQREQGDRLTALRAMDLFESLTKEEHIQVSEGLATCIYAPDDLVFRQGEPADSLFLLARGHVTVVADDRDKGTRHKLATLEAPGYFGEMGLLLGQPRSATVIADGEVVCYRLDKRGFDSILQARPELAERLAKVLAQRQAANDATLQALDAEARAKQAVSRATDLVRKIQQFFGLRT